MSERREALLIACDKFVDPRYKGLAVPISDARAFAKILEDPEIGQFSVQIVENQTRDSIADKLVDFFENRRSEDVLLLYFAGHGDLDDRGNFYFVAANTRSDRLSVNGLSDRFIHETMVRSLSKRQILILDCCFSGAFAKDWFSRADASVGIRQKLTGKGRIVLTASDAIEFAYEKRDPSGAVKSLFTSRVIEGMEGGQADLDGDGLISVEELYNYVEERIRSEDPSQKPLKIGFVHGQLWLGRAVPRPDAIPRNVLDLLQHNNVTVRLAGIDELERLISLNKDILYRAASEALNRLLLDADATVKRVAAGALRRLEPERRESEEKTKEAFPSKGTAVLCSSSAREVSFAKIGSQYTAFAEALLGVLREGNARISTALSLWDIQEQVNERLRERFPDGPRPEVHSPDQTEGDVARIRLFPNPTLKVRGTTPRPGTHTDDVPFTEAIRYPPSPNTTLAILLGVSKCPRSPHLADLPGAANAADGFYEYLIGNFGLPEENVKDLFDSRKSPAEQLREIGEWLFSKRRLLRDLILLYTGHAGFAPADHGFFMATRHTTEQLEGGTSIRIVDLATTLKTNSQWARKYLIFDCSFSGSTVVEFM